MINMEELFRILQDNPSLIVPVGMIFIAFIKGAYDVIKPITGWIGQLIQEQQVATNTLIQSSADDARRNDEITQSWVALMGELVKANSMTSELLKQYNVQIQGIDATTRATHSIVTPLPHSIDKRFNILEEQHKAVENKLKMLDELDKKINRIGQLVAQTRKDTKIISLYSEEQKRKAS